MTFIEKNAENDIKILIRDLLFPIFDKKDIAGTFKRFMSLLVTLKT